MAHRLCAHVFGLVALLGAGCGLGTLPCPTASTCIGTGPRCSYIEGADACSMIPKRYTCECTGRIVPVAPSYSQPPCGAVRSWCEGRVLGYHEVASFQDLLVP